MRGLAARQNERVERALVIPGFVNAHSHAFQRALRGRAAGRDFWAWRETMLAEAARQTVASVRAGYELVYREMAAAGFVAVGEFHYLGLDEARAAAAAARAAGIELVLLLAAYERGGIARSRQASVADYLRQVEELRAAGARVGVAPHSVRACSRGWLEGIGAYAAAEGLVLHVHACEQEAEIDACLAEHGVRPVELLASAGCLGPHATVVHATHASDGELDAIADAGARVCLCPLTEADLADGLAPVDRLLARGVALCIGSDANVRIDPFEELRTLDGILRAQTRARGALTPAALLAIGAAGGAAALGIDAWPDVAVDLAHPSLAGLGDAAADALVSSASADAVVPAGSTGRPRA